MIYGVNLNTIGLEIIKRLLDDKTSISIENTRERRFDKKGGE
jgi:hypothetical protein